MEVVAQGEPDAETCWVIVSNGASGEFSQPPSTISTVTSENAAMNDWPECKQGVTAVTNFFSVRELICFSGTLNGPKLSDGGHEARRLQLQLTPSRSL